jgi:hypothetical protein
MEQDQRRILMNQRLLSGYFHSASFIILAMPGGFVFGYLFARNKTLWQTIRSSISLARRVQKAQRLYKSLPFTIAP